MKSTLAGFLCGIALFFAARLLMSPSAPDQGATPSPAKVSSADTPSQTTGARTQNTPSATKPSATPDIPRLEQKLKDAQAKTKSAVLKAREARPLTAAIGSMLDEADETNTQFRYRRMRALEEWYDQNAFAIRDLEIEQEDNLIAAAFFAAYTSSEPIGSGTLGEATRVSFEADPDLLPLYRKQFANTVRTYLGDLILADHIERESDINHLNFIATDTLPRLRGKFLSNSAAYNGAWGDAFRQNERYLFLLRLSQRYNKSPIYREAQDRVDKARSELSAAKEAAAHPDNSAP